MPPLVGLGATLQCTFGLAPSTLAVLPAKLVNGMNKPLATITDIVPVTNIPPFGMCNSPSNPTVIAATAAALGVLTPMPCVPVIPAPWAPGKPLVMVGKTPALDVASKCMCTWTGVISVVAPGQTTVMAK